MTDTQHRTHEREATADPSAHAKVLRDRMRRAETTACGMSIHRAVEVVAFLGDEAARDVVGWTGSGRRSRWDLNTWLSGLKAVCSVEESCPQCAGVRGLATDTGYAAASLCNRCSGSGKLHPPDLAGQRVLVMCAVTAARAAFLKTLEGQGLGLTEEGKVFELDPGDWCSRAALNPSAPDPLAPKRAIDAAEAWAKVPSDENKRAWGVTSLRLPHLNWVPRPTYRNGFGVVTPETAMQTCGEMIGEQTVRDAIKRVVVPWVLADR